MSDHYKHRKEWATLADVNDYIIEAERDQSEREPKFYVSDFGLCHRRAVLKRAGLPGRPMSAESKRNLAERSMVHDDKIRQWKKAGVCIAGDTGTKWTKENQTTRLSDAFPPGFGCRADAICHALDCPCDQAPLPMTVAWGRMTKGQHTKHMLAEHNLWVVEVKTAHPNLVNYAGKLPKVHNVLQARAAAWAIRRMYGLELKPQVVYFPIGSSAKPLQFDCGGGQYDAYEDVDREITSLQMEWDEYQRDGTLPPVMPLDVVSKKEGPYRVQFYQQHFECNPAYCQFSPGEDEERSEGMYVCPCLQPQNKTGDRFGYLEDDGTTTWVMKWTDKLGMVAGIPFIETPRGKDAE